MSFVKFWQNIYQILIKRMKHIRKIFPERNDEVIKQYVNKALELVYQKDRALITHQANERSIVFRFGLYLYEIIKNSNFSDFDIDVEYNRNGYDAKRIPSRPNGSYPDLIIHCRTSNECNLLVLEFKTEWSNQNQQDDESKIRDFMNKDGEYKFRYGATILIKEDDFNINWIEPYCEKQ